MKEFAGSILCFVPTEEPQPAKHRKTPAPKLADADANVNLQAAQEVVPANENLQAGQEVVRASENLQAGQEVVRASENLQAGQAVVPWYSPSV
jgi:hypothetical protein